MNAFLFRYPITPLHLGLFPVSPLLSWPLQSKTDQDPCLHGCWSCGFTLGCVPKPVLTLLSSFNFRFATKADSDGFGSMGKPQLWL